MVNETSRLPIQPEQLPLHELISQILAPDSLPQPTLPFTGTMQWLNHRLTKQPQLDFFNATFRGMAQVIFVNNPVSGLLIFMAMLLQSPWLGVMSFLGTAAATLTAILLNRIPLGQRAANRSMIQNGIFGLNGLLVGAVMSLFGSFGNGVWNPVWVLAILLLAALATLVMQTGGVWFATQLKAAPLGLAFNGVMLAFFLLIAIVPQPFFDLGAPPPPFQPGTVDGWRLLQSLPVGLGKVFFLDNLLSIGLVIVAVALCTRIGVVMGLVGCVMYLVAGLLLKAKPDELYLSLWGYNAVLTAIAIGGIFYAPNRFSLALATLSAFLVSVLSLLLVPLFTTLQLPILCVPFSLVTIGCFLLLQRSLPSLVPVALHTVASPEEHRQRFLIARKIIVHFRQQLAAALQGQSRKQLFEQASPAIKGDLRYLFNAIDHDRSGQLSITELTHHLQQSGKTLSASEISLLFKSMDSDRSNTIDFEEFGELMLRHRQLMAQYNDFVTYFLPINVDEDDAISLDEMNVAMASVGEPTLTHAEVDFLRQQSGGQPLSWNRFIELLLVI